MGLDPEEQVAVLQSRVRERLVELRPIRAGTDGYGRASDAVIEAASALIDYEGRLPTLLDQAPRRTSLLIVRWAGVLAGSVAISLGVAAAAGWLSRWWLPAAVLLLLAAAVQLRMPVHPPCQQHQSLRPGAVLVAAGTLVIAVGAAGTWTIWIVISGALLLAAGLWYGRRNAPAEMTARDDGATSTPAGARVTR